MQWAVLIQLVLKLVANVSEFLARKQLLEAGKAEVIRDGLQQTLANLEKADHVKQELVDNPGGDFAQRVRKKYERTGE